MPAKILTFPGSRGGGKKAMSFDDALAIAASGEIVYLYTNIGVFELKKVSDEKRPG